MATPALKDAIISKFKRENGLTFARDQITVGTGGKQVLYNAIMATVGQGDEVIIPAPYWVSYPDMVNLAEGTPVFVDTDSTNGFKLAPEVLAAAITPKTKWLILNSPSNPCGGAYKPEELQTLADVLLQHPQVWVLTDDIYEHLVYDGFTFSTIAQVEPKLADRVLTMKRRLQSLFDDGWRIGYAAGPARLIKAIGAVQSHSTSNPCLDQPSGGCRGAERRPVVSCKSGVKTFQQRRDMVVAALNETPGLTCATPEGAFYVYPSCAGLIGKITPDGKRLETDEDVAGYLWRAKASRPCMAQPFGMSPYFRISYATSTEQLTEACARINGRAPH